jgi:hypothetical protein
MGFSNNWPMPVRKVPTRARSISCYRSSKAAKPKDQFEAMLSAQIAAVHAATMTFARRLAHVETIPQQDSAERTLNKLARTYAMQMEALKHYRTGGRGVQHVSVNDGGQAIVGNVN